jgi:chemotaxis protein MotA
MTAGRARPRERPEVGLVVGLLATAMVLAGAILATGRPADFVDPAALLVVLGGTVTVTVTGSGLRELIEAGGIIARTMVRRKPPDAEWLSAELVRLAWVARRDGLLVLEKLAPSLTGLPVLQRGIDFLLEGREPAALETLLREDLRARLHVVERAEAIVRQAAEVAPAMGLLGTLVGLVRMLSSLDAPEHIGPGMAVALLTTLYGALLAHAVLTPLARQIQRWREEEALLARVQLETVLSMARRENPRLLSGLLASLLQAEAAEQVGLTELSES